MKCQKCNSRIASVLVRQTIDGKDYEYKLCSECAKELGLLNHFDPNSDYYLGGGLFASQFLTALNSLGLGSQYNPGEVIASRKGEACCTKCKTTLEEMRQTGRLGCSNCYNAFEEQLVQVFRRIQSGEMHRGRKKAENIESSEIKILRNEISDLQDRIKDAIVIEDYESAAKWKTRILQAEELIKSIEKTQSDEPEDEAAGEQIDAQAKSLKQKSGTSNSKSANKIDETESKNPDSASKTKKNSVDKETNGNSDDKIRKTSKGRKAKPKEGEDAL